VHHSIVCFSTACLNDPKQWLPLKLDGSDNATLGKLLLIEEVEHRSFREIPSEDRLYTARDPDNQQICFLLITTEWSDGKWSLFLCYKTEENKIVEFYTYGLNHPNDWRPLKCESTDPNHLGKTLLAAKIDERMSSPLPIERILSYLEKE